LQKHVSCHDGLNTGPKRFVSNRFGYSLWLPESTPSGQPVSVETRVRDGVHVMHAASPDQSELYFEVCSYTGRLDHPKLAAEQREFLRIQSHDGRTTAVAEAAVGELSGTTFDFRGTLQGRWKERRFFYVDGNSRTYRIVHDPTSDLNARIFRSLELRSR
jgi:hypothetical protein